MAGRVTGKRREGWNWRVRDSMELTPVDRKMGGGFRTLGMQGKEVRTMEAGEG